MTAVGFGYLAIGFAWGAFLTGWLFGEQRRLGLGLVPFAIVGRYWAYAATWLLLAALAWPLTIPAVLVERREKDFR